MKVALDPLTLGGLTLPSGWGNGLAPLALIEDQQYDHRKEKDDLDNTDGEEGGLVLHPEGQ